MALDLTSAREAITATFQTRTLTMVRDGDAYTAPCGLSARSGGTSRGDAADVERGEYRLTLPAGSILVLAPGDIVTVEGRRYRVVWAPARGNLNLSDAYGVTEVR